MFPSRPGTLGTGLYWVLLGHPIFAPDLGPLWAPSDLLPLALIRSPSLPMPIAVIPSWSLASPVGEVGGIVVGSVAHPLMEIVGVVVRRFRWP
jgi:hypothetical protein